MKQKILIVFGTRPEAIKMAPLVKALKRQPDKFESIVCVTGQHREMLDQVFLIAHNEFKTLEYRKDKVILDKK